MSNPVNGTRDALSAAILENPDDDAPRLVYADWLEEHGDAAARARGEYIRLGCRLACLREWDEGYVESTLRAYRLRAEHGKAWLPPAFPGDPERRSARCMVYNEHRGFLSRVRFGDKDEDGVRHWLAHLPITQAEFSHEAHREPALGWLGDPAIAERFRELEPWVEHDTDVAHRVLAQAFRSNNLRRLTLGGTFRGNATTPPAPAPGVVADLLRAPSFRRLEGLSLHNQHFTDEHFRHLALVDLPDLTELRAGHGLTPKSAQALARAKWFGQLTELDLTDNWRLGDGGLTALLKGMQPGRLRSLCLENCELTGSGWSALAAHGPASLVNLRVGEFSGAGSDFLRIAHGSYRLEALYAGSTVEQEDSQAAARLFSGPAVAGLRLLDWSHNHLGEEGAAALATAPFRETLRVLILKSRNHINDAGVRHLCSGSPWKNLAHLDLTGNPISPEEALTLVEHPNLARLVSLELTIEDRPHVFVKNLARSRAAARFRYLHLDCRLTASAVKALIASPHLDGLEGLTTGNVSDADRERLDAHFGPRRRAHYLFP
jgi:uncharacterized protein (TIGR02996 family)